MLKVPIPTGIWTLDVEVSNDTSDFAVLNISVSNYELQDMLQVRENLQTCKSASTFYFSYSLIALRKFITSFIHSINIGECREWSTTFTCFVGGFLYRS